MPVTQQHQPIGWRNELSALLRLAVPLMATQLVQVLMVFTDTLMMGLLGYLGLGAPLAWYLAFSTPWGASGVWWGMAAGLAGTALGLVLAFERRLRPALSHRQKTDFYSGKALKG